MSKSFTPAIDDFPHHRESFSEDNPIYDETTEQEDVWMVDFDGTIFNTEKVKDDDSPFIHPGYIKYALRNTNENGKVQHSNPDGSQREYNLINVKAVELLNQKIKAGEKVIIFSSGAIPETVREQLSRKKRVTKNLTKPESELLYLLENSLSALLMNKHDLKDGFGRKITKNTRVKKLKNWFSHKKDNLKNIVAGKKCYYLGNGLNDLISVEILEKRIGAAKVEFIDASIDKDADELGDPKRIKIGGFSSDVVGRKLKWWQSADDKYYDIKKDEENGKSYIEIEDKNRKGLTTRHYLHTPDYCLDTKCVDDEKLPVFSGYVREHQFDNQEKTDEPAVIAIASKDTARRARQSEATKKRILTSPTTGRLRILSSTSLMKETTKERGVSI